MESHGRESSRGAENGDQRQETVPMSSTIGDEEQEKSHRMGWTSEHSYVIV